MKKLSIFIGSVVFTGLAFGQDFNQADRDFDGLDANDDEYITQDEMRASSSSADFSQIDNNADGMVSRDEFRTYSASQSEDAGPQNRPPQQNRPESPVSRDSDESFE